MIAKTCQNIGTFTGTVAAGARLTFELPKIGCYNALMIRCKKTVTGTTGPITDDNMLSSIGDIEITLNGDMVVKMPAYRMVQLASLKMRDYPANAGFITIPLYDPRFDTFVQRYNLAWSIGAITSATIALNVVGVTDIPAATFDVFADWDTSDNSALGAYACYNYQDLPVTNGQFDNQNINTYGQDAAILGHYVELVGGSSPAITGIFVDLDGTPIVNNVTPEVLAMTNRLGTIFACLGTDPFAVKLVYDGANQPAAGLFVKNNTRIRFRGTVTGSPTGVRVFTYYAKGAKIG